MRVLVVDDSAYARKRLRQVLEPAGYEVLEAPDGETALKVVAEQPVDLVTVDLLMPGMDGMDLIRQLRNLDASLPLVVVTADVQEATRAEALAAGASAFFAKVEKPEVLLSTVNTLLGAPYIRPEQLDAFRETLNIAMGQAASALEALLRKRCRLQVPEVEAMPVQALPAFFRRHLPFTGAAVLQAFTGVLSGLTSLLFPEQHATALMEILLGGGRDWGKLSTAEQTVLAEVGNIVLNTVVAVLADRMEARLKVGLPIVVLGRAAPEMVDSLLIAAPQADHALVLVSRVGIAETEMEAYLLLLLPEEAVQRLLAQL